MSDISTTTEPVSDEVAPSGQMFSNRTYDWMKYLAQIVLPAVATLYFALSQIWGLPKGHEVVGTITAVDAFLGVILQLSSAQYNRKNVATGEAYVDISNPTSPIRLSLDHSPEEMAAKDKVTFKVVRNG